MILQHESNKIRARTIQNRQRIQKNKKFWRNKGRSLLLILTLIIVIDVLMKVIKNNAIVIALKLEERLNVLAECLPTSRTARFN